MRQRSLDGHLGRSVFAAPHPPFALLTWAISSVDRATGYEPVGREFKSLMAHQTVLTRNDPPLPPASKELPSPFDWHSDNIDWDRVKSEREHQLEREDRSLRNFWNPGRSWHDQW